MKSELFNCAMSLLKNQNFDSLAVGVIDFSSSSIVTSFEISPAGTGPGSKLYFDLASLTKPLTLASLYLIHPDYFGDQEILLLNHRSGLPAWGRLSKNKWRDQILSYKITESETVYSDFSALRLMLELEQKSGSKLYPLCSSFWDKELMWWKHLPEGGESAPTGNRNGKIISGEVNDDNAFVIDEPCSHAGLFSTMNGLCRSLINLDANFGLIERMNDFQKVNMGKNNFLFGWDRPFDLIKTLAGRGCSKDTFGHLGFTGTSIWIDGEKKLGNIILSNATQNYWYDRDKLNQLRRKIGEMIWKVDTEISIIAGS